MPYTLNIPISVPDDTDDANSFQRLDERRAVALALLAPHVDDSFIQPIKQPSGKPGGAVLVVHMSDGSKGMHDLSIICIALRQPFLLYRWDNDDQAKVTSTGSFGGGEGVQSLPFIA